MVTKKQNVIPFIYGYDADIRNIINFAKNNNIKVIEDTAQAFGSKSVGNNYLGTSGDINAFLDAQVKRLG